MARTVLSSLELERGSHQSSHLLEAEKTTPESRRLAQQRGVFPRREAHSEPAHRPVVPTVSFRQSRVPKTGVPQAAQAAAGTAEWRPTFPGRKRGLGTRARTGADASADRLPPPPPQHSTSAWEPCGQRHRLSPRLPDRTRAFLPLLPRPRRCLSNCAALKHGEDFSTSLPPSAISLRPEKQGLHSVTF